MKRAVCIGREGRRNVGPSTTFALFLMDQNKCNSSSYREDSTTRSGKESTGEENLFSFNPFFRSLRSFVRRGTATGGDDADNTTDIFCSAAASLTRPASVTCLSPGVLDRLRFVGDAAAAAAAVATDAKHHQRERPPAKAVAPAETQAREKEGVPLIGEDGRITWSLVRIAAEGDGSEGEEEALAEGARLAVECHAVLQRSYQQRQLLQHQRSSPSSRSRSRSPPPLPLLLPQEEENERLQTPTTVAVWARRHPKEGATLELPFAKALPGVIERIVEAESRDEEIFVALCVCLTILERALYDIYHQGATNGSRKTNNIGGEHSSGNIEAPEGGSDGSEKDEGVGDRGASVVAPAMILRDLIATPEIKSALPEQMVAVLRLLLLPMGFNIRNLVWHGFLAPHELPRELASLVLIVTLSFPVELAFAPGGTSDYVERTGEDVGPPPSPQPPSPLSSPLSRRLLPLQSKTAHRTDRRQSPPSSAWWALDSFDERLACPRALTSAVESLLSVQYRDELDALVRRSAFVLPGREGMALQGLRALGDGRNGRDWWGGTFFLVALLPVLEHGLRCLFSCANDSPGHLFAHLRQYYSTLDGFGQRARHQLLLDQEMTGFPDRENLLLAALGPGLSACLLDLFMMSAGPNLRGKVAHGEMDMSGVFPPFQACSRTAHPPPSPSPSSSSDPGKGCGDGTRRCSRGGDVESWTRSGHDADVVKLTAGVFIVLCWKYDLSKGVVTDAHPGGIEPNIEGIEPTGSGTTDNGGGSNISLPPRSSNGFVQALHAAEVCCSGWVPRFHPHELLEIDLQASREEFDHLALALERRVISVELLPAGDLACMSVVVLGGTVSHAMAAADREAGDNVGNPPHTQEFDKGEDGGKQQQYGLGGKGARKDAQSSEDTVNHGETDAEGRHIYSPSLDEAPPLVGNDARMVLKVTDTTRRLVPPTSLVNETAGGGSGHAPLATSGSQGSAARGVFPGLLRVDEALREHVINLAARFERSTTHHQHSCEYLHGGGSGSGGSTECHKGCAALAAIGEIPISAPTSAFAVHFCQHSQLCPAAPGPPCCLDSRRRQGKSDFSLDDAAKDKVRATNAESVRGPLQQDGSALPTTRKASSGRGPFACADDKQWWNLEPSSGGGRRISPTTNVIKAVPLPQIACMSGLCRSCAEIARGLRERIVELEALLAAGSARSGQRRAYATTLRVAPTLLRFLASAIAAVELFVIEWGRRTASSARTAQEGPGKETAALPPDGAAGLYFLRRLATVNGALGLCVSPVVEPGSGSSSSSKGAACKERAGGAGKKGFVQALAELASFLETKTARQGFAGCG